MHRDASGKFMSSAASKSAAERLSSSSAVRRSSRLAVAQTPVGGSSALYAPKPLTAAARRQQTQHLSGTVFAPSGKKWLYSGDASASPGRRELHVVGRSDDDASTFTIDAIQQRYEALYDPFNPEIASALLLGEMPDQHSAVLAHAPSPSVALVPARRAAQVAATVHHPSGSRTLQRSHALDLDTISDSDTLFGSEPVIHSPHGARSDNGSEEECPGGVCPLRFGGQCRGRACRDPMHGGKSSVRGQSGASHGGRRRAYNQAYAAMYGDDVSQPLFM
jgi:hypothetical protein